jgi:hypothetical protein
MLEHQADIAFPRRLAGDVLSCEANRSFIDPFKSGDDAQECRLTRTGRPKQRQKLARSYVQRDPVEGYELPEATTYAFDLNTHLRASAAGRQSGQSNSGNCGRRCEP